MGISTVLYAWELGAGMGHIDRLLLLSKRLEARGHRAIFAIKDMQLAARINHCHPGQLVVKAPASFSVKSELRGVASSYADVLFRTGYDDEKVLRPLVDSWLRLFSAARPTLIVCDHSPTVVLSAAGRVPVLHVGSGFATPPPDVPFRVFRPEAQSGASEREAQVLDAINAVRRVYLQSPLDSVPQLFAMSETLTCCIPELDPYVAERSLPANGPLCELPSASVAESSGSICGYLTAEDARTRTLIDSLVRFRIPAALFVRGATLELQRMCAGSTVSVLALAKDIAPALRHHSAILHHGGLATTEASLAIGRPQYIFPRHLEQSLTADTVQRIGCGVNVRSVSEPGLVIRDGLFRRAFMIRCLDFAKGLAFSRSTDALAQAIKICEKFI